MKSHINVSSKQGMQKSEKIRNTPTSYIYFGADNETNLSDKHSVTSTSPLFNGTIIYWCSKKNNQRPLEAVSMQKKEQYTQ